MDKRNFAFGKTNYLLLAVGVAVVVIGFILMSGGASTTGEFNPEVFSAMRIKVAPVVTLLGYVSIVAAILVRPRVKDEDGEVAVSTTQTPGEDK